MADQPVRDPGGFAGQPSWPPCCQPTPSTFRYNAEAVVAALAGAGRLVPSDADTRPTFGVRMTYDDGTVTEDECERSLADARVRFHTQRRIDKPGWRVVKAELIERTWRVGPWVPVPTPKES